MYPCIKTFRCTCPDGFHGSRCEMTHASFSGSGWGWVEGFDQCEQSTISLEFITEQASSLLLYYGPMYEPQGSDPRDFLSVELAAGYGSTLLITCCILNFHTNYMPLLNACPVCKDKTNS